MENFEYYNPVHVVFGEDSLEKVGQHAALYGKNALLVTYKKCDYFEKTIERIEKSLKENGVSCTVFHGITANPRTAQAEEGVRLCR